MSEKYNNCVCWIDIRSKVLSFHPMDEFEPMRFDSKDELMQFALNAASTGYRVQ